MQTAFYYLAQVYGGGTYDSTTYGGVTTTGGGGTSQSGGQGTTAGGVTNGVLTNTGFDLVLAGTLACAIIFAALIVRFWKKPKTRATDSAE